MNRIRSSVVVVVSVLLLVVSGLSKKRVILFDEHKQDAERSLLNIHDVILDQPSDEISFFGWVKPSIDDYQDKEVQIFQVIEDNPVSSFEIPKLYQIFSMSLLQSSGNMYYLSDLDEIVPEEIEFTTEEKREWFFFYFGYNPQTKTTILFIKMENRIYKREIAQTFVKPVYKLKVILDSYDSQMSQFKGNRDLFTLASGPGAYIDSGFRALRTINRINPPECVLLFITDIYQENYMTVCDFEGELNIVARQFQQIYVPEGKEIILKSRNKVPEIKYGSGLTTFSVEDWVKLLGYYLAEVKTIY